MWMGLIKQFYLHVDFQAITSTKWEKSKKDSNSRPQCAFYTLCVLDFVIFSLWMFFFLPSKCLRFYYIIIIFKCMWMCLIKQFYVYVDFQAITSSKRDKSKEDRVICRHQCAFYIFCVLDFVIFSLWMFFFSQANVYGHTMLNTPVLVRSLKLSNIGPS